MTIENTFTANNESPAKHIRLPAEIFEQWIKIGRFVSNAAAIAESFGCENYRT